VRGGRVVRLERTSPGQSAHWPPDHHKISNATSDPALPATLRRVSGSAGSGMAFVTKVVTDWLAKVVFLAGKLPETA
jgi:hypothetical protein